MQTDAPPGSHADPVGEQESRPTHQPASIESLDYLPPAYRLPDGEERWALSSRPPRCVFIEVTNRCNSSCNTCPHTFATYEEPKTMIWERFTVISEMFPALERAVLHGIGEPLLNRELARFISYLKARNAAVLFNTNGLLLDDGWGRALIASGLDEMRVSLDAATSNTYARIRGRPLLERVLNNLAHFSRIQRQENSEKPRVSIWMTGVRENIAELPGLVRLAAGVGVPEVYVQRMVYYLDSPNPPGLMESSHDLVDHSDNGLEDIIGEAESVARELGIVLRASGATDPRRSLLAGGGIDSSPWRNCARPWTTAYVTANGNCLPCCISPFATTDYGSLIMGNLLERDFREIWQGERYRAWRGALLSESPPSPCRGCGIRWSL